MNTRRRAPKRPHPRVVALEDRSESGPDATFADGARDELVPDLRHRLISDLAYARYCARGYVDGFDIDDWLEAEAEVGRLRLRANEGD